MFLGVAVLFDKFDRVRIVSLKSRSDRRSEMNEEIFRVGLDKHGDIRYYDAIVTPFSGCFRSPGSNGCYHSHLDILREAARDKKSVLILQDDCDFLPEVHQYELPSEWDIFYGGYEASNPNDLHNSDIIGAHFMGFSSRAAIKAEKYLTAILDLNTPSDPSALLAENFNPKIRPPIDGSLVWFRKAHPELKTVFHMLGYQRASRTDLGGAKVFDRVPVIRNLSSMARSQKRKWERKSLAAKK